MTEEGSTGSPALLGYLDQFRLNNDPTKRFRTSLVPFSGQNIFEVDDLTTGLGWRVENGDTAPKTEIGSPLAGACYRRKVVRPGAN
jgi:hypothetical protein